MKILHLEYAGKTGGIEKLCKDIGLNAKDDQHIFWFIHEGGILYDEMKNEHLQVECLHLGKWQIFELCQKICCFVAQSGIDAIIIHHPAPLIWLAMEIYLCKKKRSKVFVYVHNTYHEIITEKKYRKKIYDNLLKRSDGIIAISKWVKQSVLSNVSIPEKKIKVIYNGVVCPENIGVINGKLHRPVQLIYIGRLIEKKGVQVLLDAYSKIAEKDNYQLNIIGDGPYKQDLEKRAKMLGLEHNVLFHGMQRNIDEWLRNADVFIHPAIWEEGFGISIIEAMSYGKICIASRKGAIPEIITDGDNGFLVESGNSDELVKKIIDVCSNITEEQRAQIANNAKDHVQKFSINRLLQTLHEFILEEKNK
ncbi:glycosyltransferase family 4 protein [Brotaphodocola sp.]|uniref:glycosyltransferase family 4 protein n=1 Tax=Brotaphodocola sp. TaxID=3073577 RepID=UPI003D7ECA6B